MHAVPSRHCLFIHCGSFFHAVREVPVRTLRTVAGLVILLALPSRGVWEHLWCALVLFVSSWNVSEHLGCSFPLLVLGLSAWLIQCWRWLRLMRAVPPWNKESNGEGRVGLLVSQLRPRVIQRAARSS